MPLQHFLPFFFVLFVDLTLVVFWLPQVSGIEMMFEHVHRDESILNKTLHYSVQKEYLPYLEPAKFLIAKAIDHSSFKVS